MDKASREVYILLEVGSPEASLIYSPISTQAIVWASFSPVLLVSSVEPGQQIVHGIRRDSVKVKPETKTSHDIYITHIQHTCLVPLSSHANCLTQA